MAVTNGYERMKQREAEIAAQQQQQRQQELMQQQRQQDLMRQRRQQAQQQQPQTAPAQTQTATAAPISSGYKPGDDVTKAKQQMEDLQGEKPGAYTPGDSVTQAQQALDAINSGKPQGYQSKYGSALDGILQQIQNPQDFKYEFNGDELFKYYADLYTQKGKQASADAMGQAAALTGGYGNSYAQQVGNQAYDQYLLSLYDKGMDMRDRAYQQYQDQRGDLYNQFNVLQGADATDYDRYRDTVGDWERERDYLTGRYDTAQNFDYNQYQDALSQYNNDLNYYTDLYNNDRTFDYSKYADQRDYEQQVKQFDESVRQFNENLNWDKMSTNQKMAASWVSDILAMGQMPSAELLQAAGLSAEDAQKLMAQLTTGGGSGGRGNPKKTENKEETIEHAPMSWLDAQKLTMLNTPLNYPLSQMNGDKNDDRVFGDIVEQAMQIHDKKEQKNNPTLEGTLTSPNLPYTPEEMMKKRLGLGN